MILSNLSVWANKKYHTLVAFKTNQPALLSNFCPSTLCSCQTEGRKKVFLQWTSIDLSSKLSLSCWGNVNCYKSVHHPVPTYENRENPVNFQKKSVSSPVH